MKKDIEAVMTDSKNAFKIMLPGIAPSLLSLALARVRLPNDLSSSCVSVGPPQVPHKIKFFGTIRPKDRDYPVASVIGYLLYPPNRARRLVLIFRMRLTDIFFKIRRVFVCDPLRILVCALKVPSVAHINLLNYFFTNGSKLLTSVTVNKPLVNPQIANVNAAYNSHHFKPISGANFTNTNMIIDT